MVSSNLLLCLTGTYGGGLNTTQIWYFKKEKEKKETKGLQNVETERSIVQVHPSLSQSTLLNSHKISMLISIGSMKGL